MSKFTAAWKFDLLDKMSVDRNLTATDFRVAYRLLHYAGGATGECFPKQETVAADIGLTDRGVRLAVSNLRINGWLTVENKPLPKRRGRTNFYRFHAAITGTTVPVKGAITGTPERNYRYSGSGASIEELFEEEEHVGEAHKARSPSHRGTRISPDFVPDPSVALAEGMTPEQAARTADNFRDYWKGVPGAKGRKADWPATWRLWCRRDADKLARAKGSRQAELTLGESFAADYREAKRKGLLS